MFILAQPVVGERKLPRRGVRAAVALGQVIQHEADDERRRGRRWTARASAMVLVRVLRPAMLVIQVKVPVRWTVPVRAMKRASFCARKACRVVLSFDT